MRRIVSFAAVFGSILTLAPAAPIFAQAILNPPPVVSPTYIAVPPPQQEIITEAPGPAYVWVSGRWERTAGSWSWNPGRWVKPPFSNAYWIPGYWQHNSGKFLWTKAHWAAADRGVVVQKPVTVPPLYEEVLPSAPRNPATFGSPAIGNGVARGSGCRASTFKR